jgi:hypothetical protein
VGATGVDVAEPPPVEVAAPVDADVGDVVMDLLLHAGTSVPTSAVAAATLATAIIRVVIRGTLLWCGVLGTVTNRRAVPPAKPAVSRSLFDGCLLRIAHPTLGM